MSIVSNERQASAVVLRAGDVIQFNTVIPYYYQLQTYIEQKIRSKQWEHGQKLPSEKALCDQFGVSRSVVRQALNALAANGFVATYRGKGSFVSAPKIAWQLMQAIKSFSDEATERGETVSTKVLELASVPAEGEIAQFLHLDEGEGVIKLHRLRYINGEPVQVVISYLPEKLCPNLVSTDFSNQSLYRVLREGYGLVIAEGVRTFESINASRDVARLLAVKSGVALSLVKSIGYLRNGVPLEYYVAWHRGDRGKFAVKLTAQSQYETRAQ